jgi:hypothetical protein
MDETGPPPWLGPDREEIFRDIREIFKNHELTDDDCIFLAEGIWEKAAEEDAWLASVAPAGSA